MAGGFSSDGRKRWRVSVKTTCAYCGVGCGIIATPTGRRTATISGDADHPANHGKLCSKGTHLGETIGIEGRLLRGGLEVGGVFRLVHGGAKVTGVALLSTGQTEEYAA